MKRPLATLAAALTLACNGTGGPTAPDSYLRVATKHGTVAVDPAADPAAVVAAIEAGWARARTRTTNPAKLDRHTVEGWIVLVNADLPSRGLAGRYLGTIVEIAPGMERALDHESQHLLAERLALGEQCVRWQDHADGPGGGGCDLDGLWH